MGAFLFFADFEVKLAVQLEESRNFTKSLQFVKDLLNRNSVVKMRRGDAEDDDKFLIAWDFPIKNNAPCVIC